MIVILDTNGIKTLPYNLKNINKYHTFIPGRNEINSEIWKAIKEYNKKIFKTYYGQILKELKPKNSAAITKKKILIEKLTVSEAILVIENTINLNELNEFNKNEKRNKVKKAIDKQIKEIKDIDKKIEAEEKKKNG